MKHLTVEEIIEFVSFNELTNDNLALASKVNGHIRSCQMCLEKVNAFKNVYDEFCKINAAGGFKKYAYSLLDDNYVTEFEKIENDGM